MSPSSNNRRPRWISPAYLAGSLIRHHRIIAQMARRDMIERYRGSMLGFLWSVLNPLLMLVVYTFVFTVIFRSNWPGSRTGSADFAINAFVGITIFNIFAESVTRSPTLVVGNANLVKRVVFPLELLPWVTIASSLFHALVNFGVLLVFVVVVTGRLPVTALLFPLAIVPAVLLTLGLTWLVSSLGVFFRDATHTVGLLVTVLMFMSPIFYPTSAVPANVRPIFEMSPLARAIEDARSVVIAGTLPDMTAFAIHCVAAFVIAWLGLVWFMRTKHTFADVL